MIRKGNGKRWPETRVFEWKKNGMEKSFMARKKSDGITDFNVCMLGVTEREREKKEMGKKRKAEKGRLVRGPDRGASPPFEAIAHIKYIPFIPPRNRNFFSSPFNEIE